MAKNKKNSTAPAATVNTAPPVAPATPQATNTVAPAVPAEKPKVWTPQPGPAMAKVAGGNTLVAITGPGKTAGFWNCVMFNEIDPTTYRPREREIKAENLSEISKSASRVLEGKSAGGGEAKAKMRELREEAIKTYPNLVDRLDFRRDMSLEDTEKFIDKLKARAGGNKEIYTSVVYTELVGEGKTVALEEGDKVLRLNKFTEEQENKIKELVKSFGHDVQPYIRAERVTKPAETAPTETTQTETGATVAA